jgi:hypothetical protein
MVDRRKGALRPEALFIRRTAPALASLALLSPGAGAYGQTPPHQRVGLWESQVTMMGRTMTTKSCVDVASNARSDALGQGGQTSAYCKRSGIVHNLDGSWTGSSTCTFPGGRVTKNQIVVTGDFNSKFAMKMTADRAAAPTVSVVSSWIGPCPATMKGGDVMMPGGGVVHAMEPPTR